MPDAAERPDEPVVGSRSGRIPELDGLRGIAILLVLLYHFTSKLGDVFYPLQRALRIGWSGVDLFFVLSGFLIGGILLESKRSPRYFATFYLRRAYRILPVYYLWISLFALITVAGRWLPSSLGLFPSNLRIFPVHLLFLQNIVYVPQSEYGFLWVAALWSLAVEEQFYLVAPALIRWLPNKILIGVLLLSLAEAPILRVLLYRTGHPGAMYSWMPSRADALAMGVLLAMGWRCPGIRARFTQWRSYIAGAAAVLFLILLLVDYLAPAPFSLLMASWGFSALALFYAGLIVITLTSPGGTLARVTRTTFLRELGTMSYTVYVVHLAVYGTCYLLALVLFPKLAGIDALMLASALTWLVAKLSWKYFETPMNRRGHSHRY
jgi:peptidoglycan/LPS O-acetylase OafA/YrhL